MRVEPFTPFEELARGLLLVNEDEGDGAHDASHLERVWRNAKQIQAEEGGDAELIAAGVLLHDCVHVPKNSVLRPMASKLAAGQARAVLAGMAWAPARVQIVSDAIESHSYSAGIAPTTTEGRILQDADRLDAIGLTGIARCFYTAGRMGSSLYDATDPRAQGRPLDDAHFALDHFPKKLLTLADGFQTMAGQRLARIRQKVLQDFYDGLLAEIGAAG